MKTISCNLTFTVNRSVDIEVDDVFDINNPDLEKLEEIAYEEYRDNEEIGRFYYNSDMTCITSITEDNDTRFFNLDM